MKTKLSVVFLVAMLVLAGCNSVEKVDGNENSNVLKVYTTIYPLQYFTERIGGDSVDVENLIPPGTDAHSVEISTKKMTSVAESDAFIHTGTALEGFAESVADALKNEDVLIVNATENVSFIGSNESEEAHDEHEAHDHEEHDNNAEHDHDTHEEDGTHDENHTYDHDTHSHDSGIDPHVWIDPNRSIILAENIKNTLIELEPKNKSQYEKNFSELKKELEQLDAEFKNMVSQSKTKTILVSHSAYGYWEDAYGITQIGISGYSPTDEPSQKKLTELIDLINKQNINYIFFEHNVSNKVAEIVKTETGTDALTLHNLESVSEEDIKNSRDYFELMRENIKALEKALN
ncbi:metal ABC transporter solute-binding protein, Zn/Mn family [Fredinandcohnia humi]